MTEKHNLSQHMRRYNYIATPTLGTDTERNGLVFLELGWFHSDAIRKTSGYRSVMSYEQS